MVKTKNLEIYLLLVVLLFGGLIFYLPIHYVCALFIGGAIGTLLLFNPKYCFYCTVFTLPLAQLKLGSIAGHAIHPYNLCFHLCIVATWFNFLGQRRVNISTKLDKWFIGLSVFVLLAGFVSSNPDAGMSIALRYMKALLLFYMTVYYFETKQVKLSSLIKIILSSALIQVFLVACPLINNSFLHLKASARGYLGLLGIGPLYIRQGRGTFTMFSDYGYFLDLIIFLMLPLNKYISKRKNLGWCIIAFLFLGVFLSYSRGALLAFILSFLYYLFLISESKRKFLKKYTPLIIATAGFYFYFVYRTTFLSTVNSRDSIWMIHLNYIKDHLSQLFIGNGWYSYLDTVASFLPANVSLKYVANYFPHNYYIFLIEEIGIIGSIYFISFWLSLFVKTFKENFRTKDKVEKSLNISINIAIFILLISGVYDQSFYHPHLFTILIFLIALLYGNSKKQHRIKTGI